jgi:hypothetical protein
VLATGPAATGPIEPELLLTQEEAVLIRSRLETAGKAVAGPFFHEFPDSREGDAGDAPAVASDDEP